MLGFDVSPQGHRLPNLFGEQTGTQVSEWERGPKENSALVFVAEADELGPETSSPEVSL